MNVYMDNRSLGPVFSSRKSGLFFITILVFAVLAIVAVIFRFRTNGQKGSENAFQIGAPTPATHFILEERDFASYQENKPAVTPLIPDYYVSTGELVNLQEIQAASKIRFTDSQLASIGKNGFVVLPNSPQNRDPDEPIDQHNSTSDEMADLYKLYQGEFAKELRKPENALFITTDFLLHVYHVLLDRTLQNLEKTKMQPYLYTLTGLLFTDSMKNYNQEEDHALKDSWKRIASFYLVPKVLLESAELMSTQYFDTPEEETKSAQNDQTLDSPQNVLTNLERYHDQVPPEIFIPASEEIKLILKGEGISPSPIYGKLTPDEMEDYSQYKPRGHYQNSSVLRSYFRSMMWYGRHGFPLKYQELTRDALLITGQLSTLKSGEDRIAKLWEDIYLPTVFFVGRSDDLTFYDYGKIMTKLYGKWTYSSFKDNSLLFRFREEADKLRGPMILSGVYFFDPRKAPDKDELLKSTKGFRFMGQRFIPDSYMFTRLTQGDERPDKETGQLLPSTPTALMVMSILGSKTADTLLFEWVREKAPGSDRIISKVKNELSDTFKDTTTRTWTQNVYWAWLYNLLPLFDKFGQGYPAFMKNPAWGKKSLVSALGSWTELRHDTLLYTKQSYAELGGGGARLPTPPAVPKGYVEPNLNFFTRLKALNKMTVDGLASRNLIDEDTENKFENFGRALDFFQSMVISELSDEIIPDETYEKLRTYIGLYFPSILWPTSGGLLTEKERRTGLVADVHTDVKKEQILYEAIGSPATIYVAVKDKNGSRITRGLVYSYYEFTAPLTQRITDYDWQNMIYARKNIDQIPNRPAWTKEITGD